MALTSIHGCHFLHKELVHFTAAVHHTAQLWFRLGRLPLMQIPACIVVLPCMVRQGTSSETVVRRPYPLFGPPYEGRRSRS
jgi:hypothetical protein